jgi:hypothetical protein
LTETQQSALIRCQPEDGMNGFFVTLFKKKSHVGTGSQSCVEFQFSPLPAKKFESASNKLVDTRPCEGKGKTAKKKRKIDQRGDNGQWSDQWSGIANTSDSYNVDSESTTVPKKKAKKVKEGRLLTLWKPKKRR